MKFHKTHELQAKRSSPMERISIQGGHDQHRTAPQGHGTRPDHVWDVDRNEFIEYATGKTDPLLAPLRIVPTVAPALRESVNPR